MVFDFDGTLVPMDTFGAFCKRLLKQRPARLLALMVASPTTIPWLLAPATRTRALSILLWLVTAGHDKESWHAAIAEFADTFIDEEEMVHSDGVLQVRAHVDAGDRVLIVTGCAEDLARAICKRLGLEGVEIVGSRLRHQWGGQFVLEHCIGGQKVRRLAREHGLVTWDHVYTDHIVDLPLMRRADTTTMVNPRPRHWKRARRLFGDAARRVHWPR